MPGLPSIFIAALTGFVSGFPAAFDSRQGPVNLTIMNEGARQGFHAGPRFDRQLGRFSPHGEQ